MAGNKLDARNQKSETMMKNSKFQMTETSLLTVRSFEFLSFGIWICFEFRYSDFGFETEKKFPDLCA